MTLYIYTYNKCSNIKFTKPFTLIGRSWYAQNKADCKSSIYIVRDLLNHVRVCSHLNRPISLIRVLVVCFSEYTCNPTTGIDLKHAIMPETSVYSTFFHTLLHTLNTHVQISQNQVCLYVCIVYYTYSILRHVFVCCYLATKVFIGLSQATYGMGVADYEVCQ